MATSVNNQVKGSDYMNYAETQKKAFQLIKSDKGQIFGLFVLCGISYALRVSDLLTLTWGDLRGDVIRLNEKKTGKVRVIRNSEAVKEAVKIFDSKFREPDVMLAFRSQKKTVYTPQQLNRLMKKYFGQEDKLITTHSLRKTFARDVYDRKGQAAIPELQILLNHTDASTTMKYIGFRHEQLFSMFEETTSLRFRLEDL